MVNYLFISSEIDGVRSSEIYEISAEDLVEIRPVIKAMLNANDVDAAEYTGYELFGHMDGFETLTKYVPSGERGALQVVDIKLLGLKEILL